MHCTQSLWRYINKCCEYNNLAHGPPTSVCFQQIKCKKMSIFSAELYIYRPLQFKHEISRNVKDLDRRWWYLIAMPWLSTYTGDNPLATSSWIISTYRWTSHGITITKLVHFFDNYLILGEHGRLQRACTYVYFPWSLIQKIGSR